MTTKLITTVPFVGSLDLAELVLDGDLVKVYRRRHNGESALLVTFPVVRADRALTYAEKVAGRR